MTLLAVGIVAASSQALAQDISEVIIQAERPTKVVVGRSSATGAPIEVITLTRRVNFADLDIKTVAGATELETRVSETAKDACKQLDSLYPLIKDADCVKRATDGAMVQVRTAVASAQKESVNR
jgi:UrcA family protein